MRGRERGRGLVCVTAVGLCVVGVASGALKDRAVRMGAAAGVLDPFVERGPKLVGTGEVGTIGNGQGKFGFSVALSADGRTALVGGYADAGGRGAVWVFTRSGSTWKQEGAKLTVKTGIAFSEFGYSVALSADGNTALIGGPNSNLSVAGTAWVFTRSGATWTQRAQLVGTKPPNPTNNTTAVSDGFGASVALSADGTTALVGAGTANHDAGQAFVFRGVGSRWVREGKPLTGSGGIGAPGFGTSVALSGNGQTAVVGGSNDNQAAGAVWVFVRSGTTWREESSKLTASGESKFGFFGCSVALSSDGDTLLVGACSNSANQGAAWLFTRTGSTWRQGPKLTAEGGSQRGLFGLSVALSSNGATALIGGPGSDRGDGGAWVFSRSTSTWLQQGSKLTASREVGAGSFGYSVALSSDAQTALIGAPGDNHNKGGAWLQLHRP